MSAEQESYDNFMRRLAAHRASMELPAALRVTPASGHAKPDGKAIARLAFLSHQKARRKERRHKRAVREWHKLEAIMWHKTYGADAPAAQEAALTVGMYANPQDVLSKD